MLRICHKLQVFYSIIQLIAVDMMHSLAPEKFPSQMYLHDVSMYSYIFPVNMYKAISPRYPTFWSTICITTKASICSLTNIFTTINTFAHLILQTKSRHLPFRSSYLGMIIQRKVTTLCERIKNYLSLDGIIISRYDSMVYLDIISLDRVSRRLK